MKRKDYIRGKRKGQYEYLSTEISIRFNAARPAALLTERIDKTLEHNNAELLSISKEVKREDMKYIYRVDMRRKI